MVTKMFERTISNAENPAGIVEVILELIIEKPKSSNQQVEENPHGKEYLSAALIDQPEIDFLAKVFGFSRPATGHADVRKSSLQALQPPPLRLVSLKMAGLNPIEHGHVGVLVHVRARTIREVETRRPFHCHYR